MTLLTPAATRIRVTAGVFLLALSMPLFAADKIKIEHAADLPRFTYPVTGSVETLVTDDAAYMAFAKQRRADIQSVLDGYEIEDKSTLRDLVNEAALIDFLTGRYDDAMKESLTVQSLQEKPSARLLSGNEFRAVIAAAQADHTTQGDAFTSDVAARVAASLKPMPYPTVGESLKEINSGKLLAGEGRIIGRLRDSVQPIVDKNHALSSDLVQAISGARYALTISVPTSKPLAKVYGDYISANDVVKPDIWAARAATLPEGKGYTPVAIGIWDSGLDANLFPGKVELSGGKPAFIAFDLNARQDHNMLFPLTPEVQANLPQEKSMMQGFSDLQSHIASPQAAEVQQTISTLKPEAYKSTMEALGMVGNYAHGTHVSGIAAEGNPYARLVLGRLSFDYKLIPDPCPSEALTARVVKSSQAYVDFFKAHHVRVVNMSWGGDVAGYESALEQCGMGKDSNDRKAIARKLFNIERNGLTKAIASAPGILFIAAAGNSDQDPTFEEDIPAGIKLPNLIAVGAVDQAGDEASFTSHGANVVVDANGYQVKSVIPGGEVIAFSGTSMAAPQVTNLAGKLFAIDPKLTPKQVIEVIESTSTPSDDKRRHLIDPKAAVASIHG